MCRLKIKNVGPVKSVDLELRRLNVIIGPQSSGKSTIAKIVSFCLWLEKDILYHQSTHYIDNKFIQEQLISYHRLNGYLSDVSVIEYVSDFIILTIKGLKIDNIKIQDGMLSSAVMSKVSYIPSERNFVTIPNISSLTLESDYMRDFLFEWLRVRSRFTKQMSLDVVNLGQKYYFDTNRGSMIVLENGNEISLEQASSGLQSVIPLLVMVTYNTNWIYDHEPELSFDKHEILQRNILTRLGINVKDGEELSDGTKRGLDALLKTVQSLDGLKMEDPLTSVADMVRRMTRPHHTHLIIEEPEQNLYPSTQRDLTLMLVRLLNNNCRSILITTHSPYILSTLNVLLAMSSGNEDQFDDVVIEGIDADMKLQLDDCAAFYISSDGTIHSIIEKDIPMISGMELDGVSDWVEKSIASINAVIYGGKDGVTQK